MTGFSRILPLVPALLLAACAREEPPPAPDPVIAAALADPLMIDPDLATRNPAGDGLYGAGPVDGSLPPFDTSRKEAIAAREEARLLAGGTLRAVPRALKATGRKPTKAAVTPARLAARLPGGKPCAASLAYSAIWAARLPEPLAIYPRGHVIEGSGSDRAGCALRTVRFVTPVAPGDVLAFYVTRLHAAGWPAIHRATADGSALTGGQGVMAWRIEVRRRNDRLTGIDIAVKTG